MDEPPKDLEIQLKLEKKQYVANEVINGNAVLMGGKKKRKLRKVSVVLREHWEKTSRKWVPTGPDSDDGHWDTDTRYYDKNHAKQKFPGGTYSTGDQQTFSFSFQLPPKMNWDHEWFVLLSADIPWRPDKNAKVFITRGSTTAPATYSQPRFCRKCGAPVSGENFCGQCGSPL